MPSDNDTTTTPNTTTTTNQHTLWTTPTEPLPNCSTPSQPSAETQPLITPTNYHILGHRNNPNPSATMRPLIFPTLSPMPIPTPPLLPNFNETYIYYPPNNMIVNPPTRLTPLCDTFLLHPNLRLPY